MRDDENNREGGEGVTDEELLEDLRQRIARGERIPTREEPRPPQEPKRWTKRDTVELIVSIVVSVVTSVLVCLKVRCGC